MSKATKNKREGKKQVPVPEWVGRHPFAPEEKRPVLLTRKTSIPRVYGKRPHQIATYLHASTDKITSTEFSVAPGARFEPPDIHSGDEVYYILKGRATTLNPETGEVYIVKQGEVLLVPKGTWHQTYNFTEETITILCFFAPTIWSDDDRGISIEFSGKPVLYKGANR